MSFKREGDDYGSLNILKKRRVAELLVETIPEDEAFLMKNGRFACMVCSYRPVFDTVNMLAVHRKGKKHIHNAECEQVKKHELDVLRQKRQHEQYVKHGRVTQGTRETFKSVQQHSLLSAMPYDKRTKTKHKPHERRPRLDLTETLAAKETTTLDSLPGERNKGRPTTYPSYSCNDGSVFSKSAPQTISEYQKLCRSQTAPQRPLRPYIRNCDTCPAKPVSRTQHFITGCDLGLGATQSTSCPNPKHGCVTPKQNKTDRHRPVYGPTFSEEHQKRAESYLHQRCGGWKKDSNGKWVKDEEAEFDSDEEPPDLP